MEEDSLPTFLVKTAPQVTKQKSATKKISKQVIPQNDVVTKSVTTTFPKDPFHVLHKDLALYILSFLDVPEILKIVAVS
jgi:hypothetical protein